MAKKTVKVDIPVVDPDILLVLCLAFLQKHLDDGDASPLNPLNMATFQTKAEDARDLRKEAKEEHALGEEQNNQSQVLIGNAEGQTSSTPDTLYYTTTRIRDTLLAIHRVTPEHLNLWGFNVVVSQTGGRRNIKIDLPVKKANEFLDLCDAIFNKHTADGASSALNAFDMALYETKKNDARTNRNNAANNHSSAQEKNHQSEVNLGLAEGQTSDTPDTCYNILIRGRDLLLALHKENEERLSRWGFNVVIGEAKSPTKKHAKSLTITVKSSAEGNPPIENATITSPQGNTAQTDANGQMTVPKPPLGEAIFTISADNHQEKEITYEIKEGDNVLEVILEVE